MADAHCRIGRVKYRSGAQLHVLPPVVSPTAQRTAAVMTEFDRAVKWTRDLYAKDFAGFVMIPWAGDDGHNCFVIVRGGAICLNTLPEFAANTIRRDNAERDTRALLDRLL